MWRMTWQALSVRLTRDTRVYNVEDDVAGIICQVESRYEGLQCGG